VHVERIYILFLEDVFLVGEITTDIHWWTCLLCVDACGRRQGSQDLLQLGHKVSTNSTNVVTTDSFHDSGNAIHLNYNRYCDYFFFFMWNCFSISLVSTVEHHFSYQWNA
jgi:hypothetical protein